MVIHLDRITHAYGSRSLIENTSITWEGPGLVLLCGESGSGKTTFLRLLQGAKPLSGTVYIDGLAMHTLKDEEMLFVRRNILSVVHQQPQLLKDTTVKAMIQQVMNLKHVVQYPSTWFSTFLHDVRQDQFIRTLSRGQVRRLAVLLATLGPARILLLDEPLDGLDVQHRKRMVALITSLSQSYRVIVATHHLEDFPEKPSILQFPLENVPPPSHHPSLRSLPIKATRLHTFSWSFLWNYHVHQQSKSSQSHVALPTFMLVFMTLIFSTTTAMGGFLQRWTHTMLGGDYRWLQTSEHPSNAIFAPSEDEMLSLQNHQESIVYEKDFDTSFFSHYFPLSIGYLDQQGYKAFIPELSVELFNDYMSVIDAPMGYQNVPLSEEELMLGIAPSHLIMLSKVWGVFPTYQQLDDYVQRHRPLVYFDFEYAPWGYVSQIAFEIVHIFARESITLFHSMDSYNEHIYATVLRFPLTPFHQEAAAWYLPYTYRIRIEDYSSFLYLFAHNPFFKHWDIQRKDAFRFRVFKHQRAFSIQHPPSAFLLDHTMHHSHVGYQFLPDQWMQGFALPILWSKEGEVSLELLEQYEDLSLEQWLRVVPPSPFARSHVYLGAQASITLTSHDVSRHWNKVGISSSLANKLNLAIGEFLLAHVFYNQQTYTIRLRIDEILTHSMMQLYLAPLAWEMMLVNHLGIGSWLIQPLAYAYFGKDAIMLPSWVQSTPFQSLQSTFQTLRWIGYGVLIMLFFLLLLPSFFVFIQTIHLALFEERRALQTMARLGFSFSDLIKFVDSKLLFQGVKMVVYFGIVFFPLEIVLQQLWSDSFGFSFSYMFPFASLLFMIGLLSVFYFGMKLYFHHDVLKQIKRLW